MSSLELVLIQFCMPFKTGKLAEAKTVLKDAIATLEGSRTAGSDYCKVCSLIPKLQPSGFLPLCVV